MAEKWRDINGYDGVYQVSDLGQVRNTQSNKILHPTRLTNGRIYVTLSSEGFQKKCTIHSVVADVFLGECPAGHEIRHKDGDCTHNELLNLEYISRKESQKRFVMVTGGYSVNLTKRVQTESGLRYCPVVESPNGRVKPDQVLVNGRPEKHSEGAYYLEWREKGKRVRQSVGKDAQEAAARRQRKRAELNAVESGVSVLPENGDGKRSVAAAVATFLEETELTKKPKTLAAYTTALNYFTESCRKLYLHEIERYDLLKFAGFLRDEKEQSPRSVYNKFETVMTFLKANGIRGLVGKNDWPRYTEKEREIPIPAKLAKKLKTWKAKADKTCGLVFPTSGCNPKLDFLDCLKACAERAELNKEDFWLHKFRSTFATRCLWAGVDLRTVQQWLGHSDMESTMRYLKPSRSETVRDKINSIFA